MSSRFALLSILVLALLALPASAWATTSDLALEATAPESTPEEGSFSLAITVTNNGPEDAQHVYLEFTIPPSEATFISATPSQGSGSLNLATGVLGFNFGTIANGNSANLTMTYHAKARGTIETTPTVSFNPIESQEDPDTTNNAVTTDIPVTGIAATPPSFADQPLGTIGPAQIVTVTNESGESVTFGSLPVTGAAAPDFFSTSIANPCPGATLGVGGSCQLALRFAPGALGAQGAQIELAPVSGPIDPLELDLTGNGIPLPVDTGPAGPQGPTATVTATAFKLTLASAVKRLSRRHGRGVVLRYASTSDAHVVLDVLKGKKRVARIESSARQGANRIRWSGKSHHKVAKKGLYTLSLTATSGDQAAKLKVPLRLR